MFKYFLVRGRHCHWWPWKENGHEKGAMQMSGADVCLPRKEDMSHFPLSMIFTLFSDSFYVFYYA